MTRNARTSSAEFRDDGAEGGDGWKPLRYFSVYRIMLAGLFSILILTGVPPRFLGHANPLLYWWIVNGYLLFAVISTLSVSFRWLPFSSLVTIQVLVDIAAITGLMYTSGGVPSGFGILLVVAVAGGSLLAPGRTAFLFAAVAALAVLLQEVYAWAAGTFSGTAYTQAGMLGATFFATAYLSHFLAARVRESERVARQRGLDLADLSALNEHIIQRMQSGVLAVDAGGRVRLVNESARHLLGARDISIGVPLVRLSRRLADRVAAWRSGQTETASILQPEHAEVDVIVAFAALDGSPAGSVLVFMEDGSAVTQRAQQLKLASLGRLTASIAHEIRNPLGAISHAAQLLGESPGLEVGDQRLAQIIREQTLRVNGIIENVTQLSRRRPHAPVTLDLAEWLPRYLDDLRQRRSLSLDDIALRLTVAAISVRMDPSQLTQVLDNLCENGLRYAVGQPRLRLVAGVSTDSGRAFLDVYDSGPGVDAETATHLFEPFFTTQRDGTGLGLYIARELCELNQAALTHLGAAKSGHGFRVSFVHPQRQGLPSE